MGLLTNKRVSFKLLCWFHFFLLILFAIFSGINYWHPDQSKINYFFLASSFILLALLVPYVLFTFFKVRRLSGYSRELCKNKIKWGTLTSFLSWAIVIASSIVWICLKPTSQSTFSKVNFGALCASSCLSAISLFFFSRLERQLLYI